MELQIGEHMVSAAWSEELVVTGDVKLVTATMPKPIHDAAVVGGGETNARAPLAGRRLIETLGDDPLAIAPAGLGIADGEHPVAAIHFEPRSGVRE